MGMSQRHARKATPALAADEIAARRPTTIDRVTEVVVIRFNRVGLNGRLPVGTNGI